jgi:hypothetical protein
MQVWSELLCKLRASGSVAKTLLVLTISTESSELGSLDCLEQMVVHERTITRWIPQLCREHQNTAYHVLRIARSNRGNANVAKVQEVPADRYVAGYGKSFGACLAHQRLSNSSGELPVIVLL